MKITALLENTASSPEFSAKHGLCLLIETMGRRLLFDAGPDDSFAQNADRLGVDLKSVDALVLSHGHADHGGGLPTFFERNQTAKAYAQRTAFMPYYSRALGAKTYVGLDTKLLISGRVVPTREIFRLDENTTLFSDVTGEKFLPEGNSSLYKEEGGELWQDDFLHEQNLLITEGEKTVLIAGCAHRGIVNILERAEEILGRNVDFSVAGFHLHNPVTGREESREMLEGIAGELKKRKTIHYTGHCTGAGPYQTLKNLLGEQIHFIACGQTITL